MAGRRALLIDHRASDRAIPAVARPADRVRRWSRLSVALLLLTLGTACTTPEGFSGYRETIQSFSVATDETRAATLTHIRELNAYERDLELTRLRADPARTLDVNRLTDAAFSPQAIQERVLAYATITDYTTHLADLADSDAPERWRLSARTLRGSGQALLRTLSERAGVEDKSARLEQAVGPVSTLVGLLGEDYLNFRRSQALEDAIKQGAPAIGELSQLLRRDVETVIFQRTRALNDPLIDANVAYLKLQDTAPLDTAGEARRQELLDEIAATVARNTALRNELTRMRDALAAFDRSHAALVAYAETSEVGTLAALQIAVRRYRDVARDLYQTYQALRAEPDEGQK